MLHACSPAEQGVREQAGTQGCNSRMGGVGEGGQGSHGLALGSSFMGSFQLQDPGALGLPHMSPGEGLALGIHAQPVHPICERPAAVSCSGSSLTQFFMV